MKLLTVSMTEPVALLLTIAGGRTRDLSYPKPVRVRWCQLRSPSRGLLPRSPAHTIMGTRADHDETPTARFVVTHHPVVLEGIAHICSTQLRGSCYRRVL